MKARVYVRVARRPHGRSLFRDGVSDGRYKVEASHVQDQRPLDQGGTVLKTLHFAVDVVVPDHLFDDATIPVVTVEVQPDGTFLDEPVVVQVPVAVPVGEEGEDADE